MFVETFKYYKSKKDEPNLSEVLDFDNVEESECSKIEVNSMKCTDNLPLGVKPLKEWNCYELTNRPGLIFIRNPFTAKGQRYWISKSLRDYTKAPNVVNLNPKLFNEEAIKDWWSHLHQIKDKNLRNKLKYSMRWATLGYHHDWDTKVYNEKMKNEFPCDLKQLTRFCAEALGFKNYSAEAAIVNFYPIGTTLSGHTDHSESDLEAPLFSFSFGQTAIFLIGGQTKEAKPVAMFLRSGDIVIMSKESRLCYHAVPRIMKSKGEPWKEVSEQDKQENEEQIHDSKRLKLSEKSKNNFYGMDEKLWQDCADDNFWLDYKNYLVDCRINFNVRQVLKEGQTSL